MSILRGFMLIGSLGKVWARSRVNRNIFSSISILAYFKMLDMYENGQNQNIVIIPDGPQPPERSSTFKKPCGYTVEMHRENFKKTMRNVNRVVHER